MYLSDGYGAYLTGPGTGTSDSINAKLSNGESIINARSTTMFAPILSAINIAGGGRAFNSSVGGNGYALGGLFNGSNTLNDGSNELATTRATNDMVKTLAANMPRQILVVEDVQASLQNKVMLQNMSNF
jgi:X-X-X-Leu-X-X-Gly heptad repeat protein